MEPPLIALSLAASLILPAGAQCAMSPEDKAWVEVSLSNWRVAERELLRLEPAPMPLILVADATCVYQALPDADGRADWRSEPHHGAVPLPGGEQVPLGPLSFAAPASGDAAGFLVMTLPSVWRAAGVDSEIGLSALMDGVMLHEIMHTRQFEFIAPKLTALNAPDDLDDDSLQARWKDNAAYVAAFEAERDALFAAALASDDEDARAKAAEALSLMRARRERFFVGADATWAAYDDIFLTMEGLGQWIAYAWYVRTRPEMTPDAIRAVVRRGGKYWSQDEGLALFLVIDRLVPGWQAYGFATEPDFAEALLARAAGEVRLAP